MTTKITKEKLRANCSGENKTTMAKIRCKNCNKKYFDVLSAFDCSCKTDGKFKKLWKRNPPETRKRHAIRKRLSKPIIP